MTIILIGFDERGEKAVGRCETEAQIARVRGIECALIDEGEALTWEDFDNPDEPRTLFRAIARDRETRIDRGTLMADRPPFAVVTVLCGRAVRLEYYEGHDALSLVFDIRALELQEETLENYLEDPQAIERTRATPPPRSLIQKAHLEEDVVPGRGYDLTGRKPTTLVVG